MKFKGVITALVTPFRSGEVDYKSFQRLIVDQMSQGVDGLVVNGTTGESPTLTLLETRRLLEMARTETGGKLPILLGTGSNSTRDTIEMTQAAGKWKADGALVVTPYYNKPPQRGLIEHFTAVADASTIPIVLYNVPSRTVAAIAPETAVALSRHDRIVGIKEASGDLNYLDQIKTKVPDDFVLLSGDDATCVEFCARGGHGVISVASHVIGKEIKGLCRIKDASAVKKFLDYENLLKLIYVESNPIPIKAAMFLLGVLETKEMRLPLVPLEEPHITQLREELRRLGKMGK